MSQRWIRDYERRRMGDKREVNESWANSKYSSMGDWREVQKIWLPSLGISVGTAWHNLKKLWRSYKIAGYEGMYRGDTAYKINRLQVALDIPRSDLPETEGMSDYEFEQEVDGEGTQEYGLTAEEIQLKREEAEAEAEARKENEDWWLSDD